MLRERPDVFDQFSGFLGTLHHQYVEESNDLLAHAGHLQATLDERSQTAENLLQLNNDLSARLNDVSARVRTLTEAKDAQLAESNSQMATLRGEMDALAQTAQGLRHRAENAESMSAARAERADAGSAPQASLTAPAGSSRAPKAQDPVVFDGSEREPAKRQRIYVEWKSKVLLKLQLEDSVFGTPKQRVLYTASCLAGAAWNMVRSKVDAICQQPDPALWPEGWTDFEDIFRCLDQSYIVVDTVEEAKREFAKLRHEGAFSHFSNFISEFIRVADEAQKTPHQQVEALKEKVSAELYNQLQGNLARPAIDDVAGWIKLFRGYASNLEEAKFRRAGGGARQGTGSGSSAPKAPAPAPAPQPAGDPMQLDALSLDALNEVLAAIGSSSDRITEEERQRRRRKQLCMYCGGGGHFVAACPAAKKAGAVKKPAGDAGPKGSGKA